MALSFLNTNATLNNLKEIFLHIAQGHEQINSIGWGEEYDTNAVTVENYPLLWIYTMPSIINENYTQYKFRLIMCDLVNADQNNETEIQSDAITILRDILFILRDGYQMDVKWGATVSPFTLKFADNVAGWFIDLNINVLQSFGACDAPYTNLFP